jgi:hypothetical protein
MHRASASDGTPSQRSSRLKFSPPRIRCRWVVQARDHPPAAEVYDPRGRPTEREHLAVASDDEEITSVTATALTSG